MHILERQQSLDTIERLRKQKDELKTQRNNIDNQIIQIDIMIRDIRQNIPKEEIQEIPKQKRIVKVPLTPEQEIAQLEKLLVDTKAQIEEKRKELI